MKFLFTITTGLLAVAPHVLGRSRGNGPASSPCHGEGSLSCQSLAPPCLVSSYRCLMLRDNTNSFLFVSNNAW